jgi:hypothetical protein
VIKYIIDPLYGTRNESKHEKPARTFDILEKNKSSFFPLDVMFYSFLFDWYSIVAIIVAIKNALTQKEVTTATFAMQYS